MFKVDNKDTRTMSGYCSGIFVINFERISHIFLGFLLLTLNRKMFAELLSTLNRNWINYKYPAALMVNKKTFEMEENVTGKI